MRWMLYFLFVGCIVIAAVYAFTYLRTYLSYRRLGKRIRNLPVIPSSNPHWQEKVIQAAFKWCDDEDLNQNAEKWFLEHQGHVVKLIQSTTSSYRPSGYDALRPELWKAAHWRWWFELPAIYDGEETSYHDRLPTKEGTS